jgi:glycosyltransferase involved in cell wall biosynthesis
MKILYIGANDALSRHELGFIAALSAVGKVELTHLGTDVRVTQLRIGSDNGEFSVSYKQIPCSSISYLYVCRNLLIKRLIKVSDYDIVFSTPRIPSIIARMLFHGEVPIFLRLWSIRAAKVVNNLHLGCYQDLFIYLPSIIPNLFYISGSTYAMALDNVTYVFARRTYFLLTTNKLIKVYPPYGFITTERSKNTSMPTDARFYIPEVVEHGDYILGFTVLSKRGVYLRAEAKPQAEALYLIAKKLDVDVVLAGSTLEDWKRVFPDIKPPKNLHMIGKGFDDRFLAKLYRNARMVVLPITFLSISNRFIEALFYGKPIVTTIYAKYLHPELIHGQHIYVSNNIVQDVKKLLKLEEVLKSLEQGAKEAYTMFFSTKHNLKVLRSILTLR